MHSPSVLPKGTHALAASCFSRQVSNVSGRGTYFNVSTLQVEHCKERLQASVDATTTPVEEWVNSIITQMVLDADERAALRTWAENGSRKIESGIKLSGPLRLVRNEDARCSKR